MEHTLSIRDGSELPINFFVYNNVNLMKHVEYVWGKDIIIGNREGDIPRHILEDAISNYPTSTEIKHYTNKRIYDVLSEEFSIQKNFDEIYQKYLTKKLKKLGHLQLPDYTEFELDKFTLMYEKMKTMLENESSYTEKTWQEGILAIFKLLFPQYIAVAREGNLGKVFGHGKIVDFVMVDSNFYIDLMEIKKPNIPILKTNRRYRNNIVPTSEFLGTVMQLENYLHKLTKIDKKHKESLQNSLSDQLPAGAEIDVSNPKGIIIFGYLENPIEKEKRHAIELLRHQYSHISDIVTYNDLLDRLGNIIKSL